MEQLFKQIVVNALEIDAHEEYLASVTQEQITACKNEWINHVKAQFKHCSIALIEHELTTNKLTFRFQVDYYPVLSVHELLCLLVYPLVPAIYIDCPRLEDKVLHVTLR